MINPHVAFDRGPELSEGAAPTLERLHRDDDPNKMIEIIERDGAAIYAGSPYSKP